LFWHQWTTVASRLVSDDEGAAERIKTVAKEMASE
jgi:hypothetical protein